MNTMYGTFFSLIPPLVAITLALITKEVYSSLFIGIIAGGLFYSGFSLSGTVDHVFKDGLIKVLSDPYNVGILIFLVTLGAIVALMNKAGGSAAFGRYASKHIKTRKGAQFSVLLLGCLIFIDDYFNCLTVGSVMKPVTDRHKISRAKLAYIIDATAAPVCIIAPISSWAAAVSGFIKGEDGMTLFVRAIPYNFYALFTILMIVLVIAMDVDFGPMAKEESLMSCEAAPRETADDTNQAGGVSDLIVPVLILIASSVTGMIYTGGFFSGTDFVTAFSKSDASVGLVIGGFATLIATIIFYLARRVLSFENCMECISEGFKTMVSPILILSLAWTLKAMTETLGVNAFIEANVKASGFMNFLPAVIFIIGCLLAFATGTSWGTFGILIPIVVAIFKGTTPEMLIISISACMAGAVCGDHCSPISDTSIMASAGSACHHMTHVTTQLPYAMTVAAISFVSYIIAGFVKSPVIPLLIGALLLAITLYTLKRLSVSGKASASAQTQIS